MCGVCRLDESVKDRRSSRDAHVPHVGLECPLSFARIEFREPTMLHRGSCHCGRIAFELEGEVTEALDCNCSLCRRRGGLLAFFPREAMRLSTDAADAATYRFNHGHIAHHFCPTCGIAPYSEGVDPGSGAKIVAINVRCLPDVDLASLKVNAFDGAKL